LKEPDHFSDIRKYKKAPVLPGFFCGKPPDKSLKTAFWSTENTERHGKTITAKKEFTIRVVK